MVSCEIYEQKTFGEIENSMIMMKRFVLMALVMLMSSVAVAQDMITKEQLKEIQLSTGNISRNQVRQILLGLCNTYKVENREARVEEYMSKQYDEDLFDCYYNVASKYLTVEDYKYSIEKKNNPVAMSATEHQAQLKRMIPDSLSVFAALAEEVISDGQSTVVEYECPESSKAKWKEVYDNPELAKNIYTLLLQSLGKEDVKLDEDEYTDIFVPCVSAKLCNWSYKLITEKELDYFIKEKNSPTQLHWKQYRNAMINSKDDNIGTAIIGKAMGYFGIK